MHQPFGFSEGFVFKAIDCLLIQLRLRAFDRRVVAETTDFAVKLTLGRLSSLSDTVPINWPF